MNPNNMFFYQNNNEKNENNAQYNSNVTDNNEPNYNNQINAEPEKSIKPPKKHKNSFGDIFISLIIIALIIGILVGGFIYVKNRFFNKEEKEENNPTEETIDEDNPLHDLTDNEVRTKLDKFINAASYNDFDGNGIFYYIIWGLNELTESNKIKITYNSLIKVDKVQTPLSNIPEKYSRDVSMSYIDELDISTFYNEYRALFHEEPTFNISSIGPIGCPSIYIVDKELGKMYISRSCNSGSVTKYLSTTYKYSYDNDYYYVYQYVGELDNTNPNIPRYKTIKKGIIINVNSFYGNEKKFETIVWKFDKDLKFVSTENKGIIA